MATTKAVLTPRQQRVKDLVDQGKKPPEIAKALRITTAGVNSHLRAIRRAGALPAARNGSRRRAHHRPVVDVAGGNAAGVAGSGATYVAPNGGTVTPVDVVRVIKEQIEANALIIEQLDEEQLQLKEALATNEGSIKIRQAEIAQHKRALEVYES